MFISLEGIEGSGKTSQIFFIKEFFKKHNKDVLITKEPGGTKIGTKIRKILLNPVNNNLDYLSELLLYSADRAQHLSEIILPALEENKIVICDRFFDATTVYQGYVRGVDLNLIKKIHNMVLKGFKPNLTILFDISAEIGLERAKKQIRNGERDLSESRFEKEEINFHKKVRQGYLELAKIESNRFEIVDASQSIEIVKKKILEIIKNKTLFKGL